MSTDNVILYRISPEQAGKHWWMTSASLEPNGELRVISGDGQREWHTIVAAADMGALRDALLYYLGDDAIEGSDVLALFGQLFTAREGEDNPYRLIQAFLEKENVPYKTTVW